MFTTADLPESFRLETPARKAQRAATLAGLQLVRHDTGCPRDDTCLCVLRAVVAVMDEIQPPA